MDATDPEMQTDASIIGQILDEMKSQFNKSPASKLPEDDPDDPPPKETPDSAAEIIQEAQALAVDKSEESPLRETCLETETDICKSEDQKPTENEYMEADISEQVNTIEVNQITDNVKQEEATIPAETVSDRENVVMASKSLRVAKKVNRITKPALRDIPKSKSSVDTDNSQARSKVDDTKRGILNDESEEIAPGRRSLRNKSVNGLSDATQPILGLKRSSRRLSKDCGESVLQNAIARKEKSYNETVKPQRLSRRLKPTAKILANLEMYAKNSNLKTVRSTKDFLNSSLSTRNRIVGENIDVKPDIHPITPIKQEPITKITPEACSDETDSKALITEKHSARINSKNVRADCKKLKLEISTDISVAEGCEPNCTALSATSPDINDCDNSSVRSKSFSSSSSISEGRRFSKKQKFMEDDKQADAVEVVGRRRSHRRPVSPTLAEQSVRQPSQPETTAVTNFSATIKRNCVCTKRARYHMDIRNENGISFCTAVDSIDGRGMGCNNLVCGTEARRASTRVPYMLLCLIHLQRLLRHNCCPGCGMFCTQGEFKMCSLGHQYHRTCLTGLNDSGISLDYCYHCGKEDAQDNIIIKLRCAGKPAFLPFQRLHYPAAKMSLNLKKNGYRVGKENGYCLPTISLNAFETPTMEKMKSLNKQVFTTADFFEASESGDFTKVIEIVASGLDIKKSFDAHDGDTALHAACAGGHLSVVNILLTAGVSIDALNSSQKTPLMVAIYARHDHIVNFLVKNGASITFKGPDGMTALHLAAKIGYKTGCEILIQSPNFGKPLIDEKDDGGWTPLVWACEHAHSKVARYLLWRGADAHIRDLEQNVPLHWAAFGGCHEILEMLLQQGCDVNAINVHKDSPLHIAARLDRFDCVVVLLAHKACPDIRNTDGDSPLDCCGDADCTISCRNAISLNMQLRSLIPNALKYKNPILTNDASNGKENNPVQCVNFLDEEPIPTDFIYITENCLTSDIVIDRKITTLQACTCTDRCGSNNCQCNNISLRCWYDDQERLLSDFDYLDPPMIFECNQACACNSITCNNRVVQRGLTQRFQLFRTEFKGWGIKTLRFIQRGTYVCEYIGEIITDLEADQREDDSYLFDLDSREGETYCIDARRYGNLARFINHHCSPNLLPVRVFIDHQDLHFPRIAFFANRDIAVDEELGFDYGEKFWIIKYKSFTCTCGASNCRYSDTTIQSTLDAYKLKVSQEETSGLLLNVEV